MNEVVVVSEAGKIKCDFDSAKKYLSGQLEEYRGMVFTEDSKTIAKKTVADLRKQKKAFSDRVKDVKREHMKPFDDFKAQADELISLYDEPIDFINVQITEFEEKRKEEKKQEILKAYDEVIADARDILPLDKIYNPRWENATFSIKDVKDEITQRKEDAEKAISAIKEMHSDVEDKAIWIYLQSFKLEDAIYLINRHENEKREILAKEQERLRREEEERIRREEREKMEAERKAQEEKEAILRQAEEEKQKAVEETKEAFVEPEIPTDSVRYEIKADPFQLVQLESFMRENGIEYRRV
jgi:hypothetical protein